MLDYQKIGTAYTAPLQSNYFIDQMFDSWMWIMIKMMYAPYGLPAQLGEVEDWARNVSLNGARWGSICRPD